MRIRKGPKDIKVMIEDPAFPYQVGRLVGAAEVTSQLLLHQDTPDVNQLGVNLANAVAWFYDEGIMKRTVEDT
jgi:hypothetical protein